MHAINNYNDNKAESEIDSSDSSDYDREEYEDDLYMFHNDGDEDGFNPDGSFESNYDEEEEDDVKIPSNVTSSYEEKDSTKLPSSATSSYKNEQFVYVENTLSMMDDEELEIYGKHDGIDSDVLNNFKSSNMAMGNAHAE